MNNDCTAQFSVTFCPSPSSQKINWMKSFYSVGKYKIRELSLSLGLDCCVNKWLGAQRWMTPALDPVVTTVPRSGPSLHSTLSRGFMKWLSSRSRPSAGLGRESMREGHPSPPLGLSSPASRLRGSAGRSKDAGRPGTDPSLEGGEPCAEVLEEEEHSNCLSSTEKQNRFLSLCVCVWLCFEKSACQLSKICLASSSSCFKRYNFHSIQSEIYCLRDDIMTRMKKKNRPKLLVLLSLVWLPGTSEFSLCL